MFLGRYENNAECTLKTTNSIWRRAVDCRVECFQLSGMSANTVWAICQSECGNPVNWMCYWQIAYVGIHTLSLQISEMGLMLFHLLSPALSTNRTSCKAVDGTGTFCVLPREAVELWKRRSVAFFFYW